LLEEIGAWMQVNDEAIYETRSMAPYKFGNVCITVKEDGAIYLIYLVKEGQTDMPSEIVFPGYKPSKRVKATLLGFSGKLTWKRKEGDMVISLPQSLKRKLLKSSAFVIKIK
jgi:alpha-L-fucosidase